MYIKEMAASLYPWDLADEGIETCLDNLCNKACVNSVYLVGVMHKEKRPLTSMFFTHNPVRKYYLPEDSRLHYKIDDSKFSDLPIAPLYSERDFLKHTDWLDNMTIAARKRGLKTGIEISHTVFDVEIARVKFPEMLQQTIDGKREGFYCLNHPIVREYIKRLYTETIKSHDVDYLQTCMRVFSTGRPIPYAWFMKNYDDHGLRNLMGVLFGTCFCDSCKAKAYELGYDWDEMMHELHKIYDIMKVGYAETGKTMEQHLFLTGNMSETEFLLEFPQLYIWLQFRADSITDAFKEIYQSIKSVNPKLDFRYNNDVGQSELAGIKYSSFSQYVDSVRVSAYVEQYGEKADFDSKIRGLMKVRSGIGFDKDLLATIAIRPNATPEIIKRSLKKLSLTGIDGISLAHYDGAEMEHLDAVKQGMLESGIEIR
jgi:hypothetical protein